MLNVWCRMPSEPAVTGRTGAGATAANSQPSGLSQGAQYPAQRLQPLVTARTRVTLGDPHIERAVRFVVAAGAWAVGGAGVKVRESPNHPRRVHVRQTEGPQPRRVDDPAPAGKEA